MTELQYNLVAWAQAGIRDNDLEVSVRHKKGMGHHRKASGIRRDRQFTTNREGIQLTLFEN